MHLRGLCNTHSCWSQDAAASKRGVESYLCEAESWKGRRCFKTHALPHLLLVLGREESGDIELRWTKHSHQTYSQDVTRCHKDLGTQSLKGFSRSPRHVWLQASWCSESAIRGSHVDILFHHTVEMDQTVALVVSTCGCSWKWGNMGKIWETHCNDPVDLDGFRRFPWICRQTSWIQLAYLEICQSFPEIKSLPRSWHVINLFARRCVGIPPKILVLVADPRHAFTVWWQTLGQQPGFMAGRLAIGHWLKATISNLSARIEPDVSFNFDLKSFISEVAEKAG